MTSKQVALVQRTWEKLQPHLHEVADLLYGRLFELAPEVEGLLPEDLSEQKKKLIDTLASFIHGLDEREALQASIETLGHRLCAYGVKSGHYDSAGAALLWTLHQLLPTEMTPEIKDAWAVFYGILASGMKQTIRVADVA